MTATEPSDWVRALTHDRLEHGSSSSGVAGDTGSLSRAVRSADRRGRELAGACVAPVRAVVSGFAADRKRYSGPAAVLHALRASRILAMGGVHRRLASMPALRGHVAANAEHDPLVFLAHPHCLARGLTDRQRTRVALTHYGHESQALGPAYLDQVYGRGGLALWRADVAGVAYDIRLMPENDVLYEGGLSLVLHVDGARVCVMSFLLVPTGLVLPAYRAGQGAPLLCETIPFVTRKQLTSERAYQAAFNRAFDRTAPAHLCLGASASLARAQGHHHVMGIDPERHPGFSEANRSQFATAYADFWTSLGRRKASPLGYPVDVPTRMSPLEDTDASRRKRARARRAHMDAVERSAWEAIRGYMLP